eukprot:scaffold111_cov142-Skeletonema_menzelii.AAC.4
MANGNKQNCQVGLEWLSIDAFFCLVNMAAGLYVSGKKGHGPVSNDHDADVMGNDDAPYVEATMESSNDKILNQQKQSSDISLRYIIIGFCFTTWQLLGFSKMHQAARCGISIAPSVICGLLFILLGAAAFGRSVCNLRGMPWR